MKKFGFIMIAGLALFSFAFGKDYKVDVAHSAIEFSIKHLSVSKVKGHFDTFSGELSAENGKLSALNGEVVIDSINTRNESRDAHIKDAEYFNVAKFPKATLKLVKLNGNKGVFELNIKGIKKQVSFDVEVNGVGKNRENKEVIGISLNGEINRKDFDISKNTPNAALSDNINIIIEIEGVEK